MRKLIKPKSRERMRSLTLTPSRSESGDGFLMFPQDSQDSSSIGSGSNSLDDPLTQKRSSSEYKETHIDTYRHTDVGHNISYKNAHAKKSCEQNSCHLV